MHHSFYMQLSYGIGHKIAALLWVIKHVRLKIITCDMDDLDLHDIPGLAM